MIVTTFAVLLALLVAANVQAVPVTFVSQPLSMNFVRFAAPIRMQIPGPTKARSKVEESGKRTTSPPMVVASISRRESCP